MVHQVRQTSVVPAVKGHDGTEELIVGTPTGCKICRCVKRRSKADAADPVFFNSVRGTPWCLVPDDAVQEELDFMRQLKVYPEILADFAAQKFVLKAGEPEKFEAYRLLLRRYEPRTTATTVTKLVELLSTQFAGDLLDCVTDFERVIASKANVLKVVIVHDCQAKAVHWLEITKHLTETTLCMDSKDSDFVTINDLDSITKYNGKVSTISDATDQSNRTITFGVDTGACRTGVPGNHHAARGYRVHWDSGAGVLYSTEGKSVVWNEWVDVVKKRKQKKLESRFVEHKGALDNQLYNAKQLVDNMNENKVLKQILIKEKFDAKAKVTAFIMQSRSALVQISEKHSRSLTILTELSKNEQTRTKLADDASNLKNLENRLIHLLVDGKQSEEIAPHGSETTSLHQLDETSLPFNMKEHNVMTIERNIIELDEKFYIIFAQVKQRQKEMDRNTMKTINVRTDQSKRKIVIRTSPENAAQCFDVACENAMVKMENSPISQCLYLHKTENKELARWMQKPTVGDFGGLKRAVRYLVGTSSTPTRCGTATRFYRVGVLFPDHHRVPEGMHLPRLRRSGNAHWQRGAVSKVLREVPEPHSQDPI